jgi:hypothetical protein
MTHINGCKLCCGETTFQVVAEKNWKNSTRKSVLFVRHEFYKRSCKMNFTASCFSFCSRFLKQEHPRYTRTLRHGSTTCKIFERTHHLKSAALLWSIPHDLLHCDLKKDPFSRFCMYVSSRILCTRSSSSQTDVGDLMAPPPLSRMARLTRHKPCPCCLQSPTLVYSFCAHAHVCIEKTTDVHAT